MPTSVQKNINIKIQNDSLKNDDANAPQASFVFPKNTKSICIIAEDDNGNEHILTLKKSDNNQWAKNTMLVKK